MTLNDAQLSDTNMSDAVLEEASVVGATLIGADLSGASLVDANLTRADLSGADLSGADLTDASIDHAALIGTEGLDDADLADALGVEPKDLAQGLAEQDVSLEARPDILEALGGACRGGVPDAAPLENRGFRPAVVLGANGDVHALTDDVPGSWEPRATRFAQLTVCVGSERRELVQTCQYFNAATGARIDPVRRFSRSLTMRLVAARTGKLVEQRVFTHAPQQCSFQVFTPYDESLVGPRITFGSIHSWLEGYVR